VRWWFSTQPSGLPLALGRVGDARMCLKPEAGSRELGS
jgi:hypothetical protein